MDGRLGLLPALSFGNFSNAPIIAAATMKSTVPLPDVTATQRLAATLAEAAVRGDVFVLDGPLGAGKTTLARYLVEALGGDPKAVASPTFTLMNRYDGNVEIVHVDAYRLRGNRQLESLGFFEAVDEAIGIVEWGERGKGELARRDCWRIQLEHDVGGGRVASITQPARYAGKPLHFPHTT
jgi:tRNA threonylcarbamoyl adenosine modification protein YjeE